MFAVAAYKMEVVSLCLLLGDAVASAVLPDVALLASNAVGTVVKILTMHATNRAIEEPVVLLLLKLIEFLLPLFHVGFELALGDASTLCIGYLALLF